jgi:hypothetical protein
MWVCSTQALAQSRWIAAWMNIAVGSTSCVPASLVPRPSTMTMSPPRTSFQSRPRGLSRKRPEPSGSSTLK